MTDISAVTREVIVRGKGRETKYPFATMDVGDQFYVYRDKAGKQQWNKISSRIIYWEAKLPGKKFASHATSVGIRVQRVE